MSQCRPHKVVSKDMTYVKQLDAYEAAVMAKRCALDRHRPFTLETDRVPGWRSCRRAS